MQASVQDLPSDIERRYYDLAVFPDDAAIPETALGTIWGIDRKHVRRLVSQFADRSLASLDFNGRLLLHDLQLDYVRECSDDLLGLHNRLLEQYRRQCPGGWDTGPNDGYFIEHLVYHLGCAERILEIRHLLTLETVDGRPAWSAQNRQPQIWPGISRTSLPLGSTSAKPLSTILVLTAAWDFRSATPLVLASFNSMASAALSGPLWEAVVIRQPASAAKWLPFVRRIPEEWYRGRALLRVAPFLTETKWPARCSWRRNSTMNLLAPTRSLACATPVRTGTGINMQACLSNRL